jgi:myo-inositol-1(or 4)-monophosphatase
MNTSLSPSEKQLLLTTGEEAARRAGALLREMLRQPREVSSKGFRDLVTDADIAAQAVITDFIRGRFPEHGFLGEEENPDLPLTGPVIWVIDPVDGTTNYSRQQPNFSVSIAAAVMGEPGDKPASDNRQPALVAGVVYDPVADELFSAAAGMGCRVNGRVSQVSPVSELAQALVALDWGHSPANRRQVLAALGRYAHEVYSIRAIGSAALALAWVAAGRLDAYLQFALGPWDAAAGAVLVREAGGAITNLAGAPWTLAEPGCLATNGRIQQQFRQLVTTHNE